MKVYIHLFILGFFSLILTGCVGNKNTQLEYNIENSGSTMSGVVSLGGSSDIAYVNQFTGSVMLDNASVMNGAIIHDNSILVTQTGGEVELIFADNSVVRISENSTLQISHKGTDNTNLDLKEGTLWARILKPFTDVSFFTLETDDLSAGVRGTSVWLVTDSGGTDIGIVDTTSTGGQSSGATIDIVNKVVFGTGDIILSEEDVLRVRHSKKIERTKMKLKEQIKMHPFVGTNTIRDIRYMHTLMQKQDIQTGTLDRIRKEMEVTMPRSDETILFLADPVIRSQLDGQSSSGVSPTEFIRYLDVEEKIEAIIKSEIPESEKKKSIEVIQKTIIDTIAEQKESKESIIPSVKKTPTKVIAPIRTSTQSSVSGEKKIPCTGRVSGEPCR